jgi:GTP-binding protein Era
MNDKTYCGYVSILGLANAGKSTLVNMLTGTKVAIVSPKAQTTRRRILGIKIVDKSQIVLVDTPGIFDANNNLDKATTDVAWHASKDSDINLVIFDVSKPKFAEINNIISKLPSNKPCILVLNKIDKINKENLLEIVSQINTDKIQKVFMISALKNKGVNELVNYLSSSLPENPWFFPEDQITDLPLKVWAAEITREQLYLQLNQELPYLAYVETESWENMRNGDIKISQAVVVSKANHKNIVLGRNGSKIKSIGQKSRNEMSKFLHKKIHLFLFVKVKEDWINKPSALEALGIK